jgi:hypothetical protein
VRFRFQQVRDAEERHTSSDMTTAYIELLSQVQRQGEVRDDEPVQRLASYLHFLYLHALLAWVSDQELSLADELAHAFKFFLRGAAPR